jgi:hypothetical protein
LTFFNFNGSTPILCRYLASYSVGRVGKFQGTDPLYQYGVGYIWGTTATGLAVVMAGYGQYLAYKQKEVDSVRTDQQKEFNVEGTVPPTAWPKSSRKVSVGNDIQYDENSQIEDIP